MNSQSREHLSPPAMKSAALKKQWLKQAFLFAFVGVSNTAVDFIVFFLLTHFLTIYYVFAQILSYGSGMLNSYLWNSKITFSESEGSLSRMARFVILNVAVLGITLVAMRTMQFLPLYVNKLLSTCIGLAVNFLLSKLWVFRA